MKRAGCWQIAYGIESGSQRVLDVVKREVKLPRMRETLRMTRDAGIRTKGYLMIGHPTETIETLEETAEFLRVVELDLCQVTKFTPYPGTPAYPRVREHGAFEENWERMNAMNFVFVPHGLTEQVLESYFHRLYSIFYSRPDVLRGIVRHGRRRASLPPPAQLLGLGLSEIPVPRPPVPSSRPRASPDSAVTCLLARRTSRAWLHHSSRPRSSGSCSARLGGRRTDGDRSAERTAMVEQQIVARGITEPRVLDALRAVPRHRFVPAGMQVGSLHRWPLADRRGADDLPTVRGCGDDRHARACGRRTASSNSVRAQAIKRPSPRDLCAHVYTVEIQPALAERAAKTLAELGYTNVSVRSGDGFRGWPEAAPFDAMLITAAVAELPRELLAQLKPGGRAVAPVGPLGGIQDLLLIEKSVDGSATSRRLFPVRFVPSTGAP